MFGIGVHGPLSGDCTLVQKAAEATGSYVRTLNTMIWKHIIMLPQCHVPPHLSPRWSRNSRMAGPADTK